MHTHTSTVKEEKGKRSSSTFDRSKAKHNRDSISDISQNSHPARGRMSSQSMPDPHASAAMAMRNRKKKQALFGESMDPRTVSLQRESRGALRC